MLAYLDSSVLLRVVLGQPGALREWSQVTHGVASALVEVECLRTIDRLRVRGLLSAEDAVLRRETIYRLLQSVSLIEVTPVVLRRAARPGDSPLGTLDAIHLASAELWRDARQVEPIFATHDRELALAARALGFVVAGT